MLWNLLRVYPLSFLSTLVSQTQMLSLWLYQNVLPTFMWELPETSHIPLKLKTVVIILYCLLFFISSFSTYFKYFSIFISFFDLTFNINMIYLFFWTLVIICWDNCLIFLNGFLQTLTQRSSSILSKPGVSLLLLEILNYRLLPLYRWISLSLIEIKMNMLFI